VAVQFRTGGVGNQFDSIKHYDENSMGLTFGFKNLTASAMTLFKENTAQLEELQTQYHAAEKRIERELADALLQTTTQQAKIAAAREEMAAYELALQDALERLKVGVGRNIDVIDAETGLTRARVNLSDSILTYNQAQVNLVYQLGLASVESLTQGVQLP
jgi:outer membrane protein TolC